MVRDRIGHAEHWHAAGEPYLAVQPGRPRTAMVRGSDHDQVIIDAALIARVAEGAPGRVPQPLQFTGYQPISSEAAQAWKATCEYIRNTVLAIPGSGAYPLASANAGRVLAATALAVFPNNALTHPTRQDRQDAHNGTLRRAVAFIEEHAREDITAGSPPGLRHQPPARHSGRTNPGGTRAGPGAAMRDRWRS